MSLEKTKISPAVSTLAQDPDTVHRLNANAYQQNAITTFNGYQYSALYTASQKDPSNIRHVTLARRDLSTGEKGWEYLTFDDYEQKTDDGHNTISMGICAGDGTIHISFDHHCDDLRFRISRVGLASEPADYKWEASLFSGVHNSLPGLSSALFSSITYPRFVAAGPVLLFEARTGKAGAGSDVLFHYSPDSACYVFHGTYLVGVGNNPYVNGLSFSDGKLHVSWTYRDFFAYEGAEEVGNDAHKAQAGPNGPENNFDLNYAYSTDCGLTWCNSAGKRIARFTRATSRGGELLEPINGDPRQGCPEGVLPSADGIVVQKLPKYSGIMNQESQCFGPSTGDFHVLNRDNLSGQEQWRHYMRDAVSGSWSSDAVPEHAPTDTGPRGCIASNATGEALYLLLPGNTDSTLSLLRRRKRKDGPGYGPFTTLWQGQGFDGEPNIDRERLMDGDGVLSVFTRTSGSSRSIVVLDFQI
ncbi:hypothetical protein MBLNU459_g3397t1 [Dothideomycetes sp. NU459]